MSARLTITHDNGNMVCLSDRSVYVRMDETLYGPDGEAYPLPRNVAERILSLIARGTDRT